MRTIKIRKEVPPLRRNKSIKEEIATEKGFIKKNIEGLSKLKLSFRIYIWDIVV